MTHRVRRFAFPALASLSLYSFLAAAPLEAVEATCANPGSGSVIKNHKWECLLRLSSLPGVPEDVRYGNGYGLVQIRVTFTSPDWWGEESTYAFWDGDEPQQLGGMTRFRIRYKFPSAGTWTWSATCETPSLCGPGTTNPTLPRWGGGG